MPPTLLKRRDVVAWVALPAIWTGLRAQPTAAPRPTPAQTEGPFYPVELPKDSDFDLLHNGTLNYLNGHAAWVEGAVTDLRGKPVAGAQVEIWQCDEAGHYRHPADRGKADPAFQGFGRVTVDAEGRYRFRTIRPAPYTGRAPHIHVKVKLAGRELLTTQLYVAGDPHNPRDFLWRQLGEEGQRAVTVPFVQGADGMRATFPIVLAS